MRKLLSQAEYARHRASRQLPGTSRAAVQRAIRSRRLDHSLVDLGDGRVRIDPEVADLEWEGKTRPRGDYHAGPTNGAANSSNGASAPADTDAISIEVGGKSYPLAEAIELVNGHLAAMRWIAATVITFLLESAVDVDAAAAALVDRLASAAGDGFDDDKARAYYRSAVDMAIETNFTTDTETP